MPKCEECYHTASKHRLECDVINFECVIINLQG